MKITFQLEDIHEAAARCMDWLKNSPNRVVALYGSMGAGKTTFTAALLQAMGSTDLVNSPTFSIINQYEDANGQPVYHMDLYRLRDEEEAIQAGIEDCFYSGNYCIVEWPEKAESLLPQNTLLLNLIANGDGSRTLSATHA
jgi:tRNA threonylcarbamoyladenosine biosynthesis protein TsaE